MALTKVAGSHREEKRAAIKEQEPPHPHGTLGSGAWLLCAHPALTKAQCLGSAVQSRGTGEKLTLLPSQPRSPSNFFRNVPRSQNTADGPRGFKHVLQLGTRQVGMDRGEIQP